jgi:hypothetical protein
METAVCWIRESFIVVSGSLEFEDIGRTHCVRSATDCNLGVVLENQCCSYRIVVSVFRV